MAASLDKEGICKSDLPHFQRHQSQGEELCGGASGHPQSPCRFPEWETPNLELALRWMGLKMRLLHVWQNRHFHAEKEHYSMISRKISIILHFLTMTNIDQYFFVCSVRLSSKRAVHSLSFCVFTATKLSLRKIDDGEFACLGS